MINLNRLSTCIMLMSIVPVHCVSAHHSRSNFAEEKVTLEGVVTSWEWKNPHVYFTIDVSAGNGATETWVIETHNTIVLSRRGWSRDTLAIGDQIVANGSPDRNRQRRFVFGDWVIKKSSGERFVINGPAENTRQQEAVRYTLQRIEGKPDFRGVWSMVPTPGGFGNRDVAADLPLTPEGEAAAADFDPLAISSIECIGTPSPSYIVFSLFEIVEQSSAGLVLRHEYDDLRRTVSWSESLPASAPPTTLGHSVAYWDGDSLVIETGLYLPHPEGNGRGIPSGLQKHTIERLTLEDDGNRLNIVFATSDPEYLSADVIRSMEFRRVEEALIDFEECDPDVARRYTESR